MTAKEPQVDVENESAQIAIVLADAEYNEMPYIQTKWYRRTPESAMRVLF